MDHQTRLGAALNRIAAAVGVSRVRAADLAHAERHSFGNEERLEELICRLEGTADELWGALNEDRQGVAR